MMVDTNNVEDPSRGLAQMGTSVGIHLILASRRPSVDVITGLIKANFPARISFRWRAKWTRAPIWIRTVGIALGQRRHGSICRGIVEVARIHGPS